MSRRNIRLVVADTDAGHTQPLRHELKGTGIEVQHAWDLDQIEVRMRDTPPDVLVVNPWAFAEDALAFLQDVRARRLGYETPVLLICSGMARETKLALYDTGISDFFEKPVDYTALAIRVRQTLADRAQSRRIDELTSKLEREKNILARYFSLDMVEMLLNEEISTDFGGSYETVTVLVFDLRGSTALAETLDPSVLSELLSELFTDVMDLIYGNKGSVNKLLGDGLLATFGVPVSSGDDALRAARAALQILEYLNTFNEFRPPFLSEPVQAGVGIATGEVFVGNVGSVRRMEYTVLGDAVNAAARLEGETKRHNHDVLIDARTREYLGDRAEADALGSITLEGREEPVEVYGLTEVDPSEPLEDDAQVT
jgi:class 3 adenylate cyclase